MLSGGSQILVSSLSSKLDDVGGFGPTVVLSDVTPENNQTWYQI